MSELIDRRAAQDRFRSIAKTIGIATTYTEGFVDGLDFASSYLSLIPPVQPGRTWYPVTEPPNHHNDVIVRGIEAIGNVTVHKIMQWDVDTWRPTDYAPSIMWKEWSEI